MSNTTPESPRKPESQRKPESPKESEPVGDATAAVPREDDATTERTDGSVEPGDTAAPGYSKLTAEEPGYEPVTEEPPAGYEPPSEPLPGHHVPEHSAAHEDDVAEDVAAHDDVSRDDVSRDETPRDERAPLEPEESPESVAEPTAEEPADAGPVTVARPVASTVPADHHPVTDAYDEAPATEQTWAPEPEPARTDADGAHDAETTRAETTRADAAATGTQPTAAAAAAPAPAAAPAAAMAEARSGDEPTVGAVATPVFVTAPTKPRPKGNRGVGILIALLATLVYAIVYALVSFGLFGLTRSAGETFSTLEDYLTSWAFWIPVIFFFLTFALLVAIVNRAGWWAYVLGSFLIGVIVYFAYIGGALLQVEAWTLTPDRAADFIGRLWTNPLTFAAAIVAREVPVWFGAWIAARGRRVRQRNVEAQEAYERELAAGPHAAAST